MSHHVIEFDEQCKSCKGTGLYVGMAEHNGMAVVCHTCKGTGCHHVKIEYDDFGGRKCRDDVSRVVEANPGIMLGKGGGFSLTDFGGMPYAEWAAGEPFPPYCEMRKFTCPCWWYQTVDYNYKPDWDECNANLGRTFSQCRFFGKKENCWERFDTERIGDHLIGTRT